VSQDSFSGREALTYNWKSHVTTDVGLEFTSEDRVCDEPTRGPEPSLFYSSLNIVNVDPGAQGVSQEIS
jgi:hypothetical protein